MAGNAILPIRFFKIILKTNLQRLKIPNKFTRIYGAALQNPVLLKPRDGTEWKVYWTKQNGSEIWLGKGWNEFAENYSLDHGYLVVFEYEGTSKFDVVILDQSSLEIDYPWYDNIAQSDDEDSVEILGELPDEKPKQKSLPLNLPRGRRAREVAEAFISSTSNPFFTVSITPSNHAESQQAVPDFEGYIENIDKNVKLQIGKSSWNVKLLRRIPTASRRFSAGWSLFIRESELRPGDICVFELINREEEDLIFEVHVFKCHS